MTCVVTVKACNEKVSLKRVSKISGDIEHEVLLEPGETGEITTWIDNHIIVSEYKDS